MAEEVLLDIGLLRFSSRKRRGVSPKRIEELRIELERGLDVMPIRVNLLGDGTYAVKDGRHRIQAHIEAGISHIYAIVENSKSRLGRWLNSIYSALAEFLLKRLFHSWG